MIEDHEGLVRRLGLRPISGGGGQITGNKTLDAGLMIAAAAAATYFTAGAAAPALGAAVSGAGAGAAGAGAGAAAGVTAAEMGALGLTGAEIAAATPAMGATAGAGLGTGATVASAPSWWSSTVDPYIPSKSTLGTFSNYNMLGQIGSAALTPDQPKAVPAPPSMPSGSTRGYQPTTNEPIQRLSNLMAHRLQATAQRRFTS